jgi:hypothetical protein
MKNFCLEWVAWMTSRRHVRSCLHVPNLPCRRIRPTSRTLARHPPAVALHRTCTVVRVAAAVAISATTATAIVVMLPCCPCCIGMLEWLRHEQIMSYFFEPSRLRLPLWFTGSLYFSPTLSLSLSLSHFLTFSSIVLYACGCSD